jgi:hypothetical protein
LSALSSSSDFDSSLPSQHDLGQLGQARDESVFFWDKPGSEIPMLKVMTLSVTICIRKRQHSILLDHLHWDNKLIPGALGASRPRAGLSPPD